MTPPIRVAIAADFAEERWASMDLVAEMVLRGLAERPEQVVAEPIRPPWRGRFARVPGLGGSGLAHNADRVLNRHRIYPKHMQACARSGRFDLFHVIDHSYAQLVHALPAGRAIVTCHDLDTFRCLLEPAAEPRPAWFRALAQRSLSGMQKAAAVACASVATRDAILAHGLLPADRLRIVPVGISREFTAVSSPGDDSAAADVLGPIDLAGAPEILHVGSNIPRKRIDLLLKIFAEVRRAIPGARLVKIGGRFTPEQQELAESLGIAPAITFFPYIEPDRRGIIAATYRRAAVALVTSDAEGFGLPVAEALACGAPILASDLPVLREVGGDSASYAPVGAIDRWAATIKEIVDQKRHHDQACRDHRASGIARAARFTWDAHVNDLVQMYDDVLSGRAVGRP